MVENYIITDLTYNMIAKLILWKEYGIPTGKSCGSRSSKYWKTKAERLQSSSI